MLAAQQTRYENDSAFDNLVRAAAQGNTEEVRKLLDGGVDVNECNEIGQTALITAAMADKEETCRFLLEKGAKADGKDIGGFTALHLTRNADIANLLLDHTNDDMKTKLVNMKTKKRKKSSS